MVELDGKRSKEVILDRGCVQGSLLGPKLFSLYLYQLEQELGQNCTVISYADDTYVIISGRSLEDTEMKVISKILGNGCE